MKLALERSEKDTIRPLDDGQKKFLSAYGGLDSAKCFDEDPRFLDDKMLQLAVVQSKELGNCDRVPEAESLRSYSPHVDGEVEILPSMACLGSSAPVVTVIHSVLAEQRESDGGSLVVPSFFPAVGGGSSILPDPSVLHLRVSWKEPTLEEICVKLDKKFCWFSRLGMQDGARKLINE